MTATQHASWVDFFKRERGRLVRYVRSLIDDAADRESEDIVQDVVLGLFEKADVLAPIENFTAYVYQSLRNRVVDAMRRKKRGHDSLDAELPGDADAGFSLADLLADMSYDVNKEMDRKEINRDLNTAISMLDENHRTIVLATELQGVTFKELSDEWKVPIGTLLARKSRAMKKMKEALLIIDPVHYSSLFKEGVSYG
jgi:RNA polymerase sigma factor (sigma-70 family)